MTADTTITIGLVIAVIGCLIGIWGFFNNYKSSIKKDDSTLLEIKENLIGLNAKLDRQREQLIELQSDIKSTKHDIDKLKDIQMQHEYEIKSIWKRLNEPKGE